MSAVATDPIPVRALNQVTYCPRLYYLQYVDCVMPTNEHVEAGLFDHRRIDSPELANKTRTDRGTATSRGVALSSESLGISGVLDVVEEKNGERYPVETKHGPAPRDANGNPTVWDNDAVQLCAQAMLLEEAFGKPVPRGFQFHAGSKERVALHAAHTRPQPILHRDLKPSNIMVLRNPDGTWTVKVIDFGLAVRVAVAREGQAVPPANRSTKDKSVTGTLKYAPPEQTGELPDVPVGPYSDVYAFGKTFLEVLFGHTSPQEEEWGELPEPVRGPLKKVLTPCVRHTLTGKYPRYANFEPVLTGLAALDSATPPAPASPPSPPAHKPAPRPAAPPKSAEAEEIPFAELLDVEPSPAPPPAPPPNETHAQKLRRLKNEQAGKAIARFDYADAVRILSDFTDEQLPYRDNAILADATVKRDRLATLAQAINAHLARNLMHHSRLPVLLAEYLQLNPAHIGWRELADELPPPETLPTNPNPGDVFTLRAWLPEPEHHPGELLTLKATIPAPKHHPGELVALRWKAVAKRPNLNA